MLLNHAHSPADSLPPFLLSVDRHLGSQSMSRFSNRASLSRGSGSGDVADGGSRVVSGEGAAKKKHDAGGDGRDLLLDPLEVEISKLRGLNSCK